VSERGTPIFISSARAVERDGMLVMDTLTNALVTIIFSVQKTGNNNLVIIFPIFVWLIFKK